MMIGEFAAEDDELGEEEAGDMSRVKAQAVPYSGYYKTQDITALGTLQGRSERQKLKG
jgi:hypothetical protein